MKHEASPKQIDITTADEVADEELMLAYAAGDAAAFDRLYARHRTRLYRFLLRRTGSAQLAEELYQDIWMKIIQARERYTPTARFSTFLMTLAHHRLVDHYRQRGPVVVAFEPEISDAVGVDDPRNVPVDPARQAEVNQQLAKLDGAVDRLSPEQRDIFLMRQESDLSLDEIAVVTGVSRETAKSRLRYAVASLRRQLEGRE